MTTDVDELADFITQAHRTIELAGTPDEYSRAVLATTGAVEYHKLPDAAVQDILHHLERKRNDVIRASGALVG